MSDIFDFDRPPPLYAVMGNPVDHSKSPEIHRSFARQFYMSIDYRRIHVDIGGFPQAVSNFQASGGQGLNVTVPFKVEAWELADELNPRAELARAVNTLWFSPALVHGDNTDGIGICRDINDNLGCSISNRRVVVLGAGGAVRGVLGELLACSPVSVLVANRTVDKAVELAQAFGEQGEVEGCGLPDLEGVGVDILINGTAASLSGQVPALPRLDFSDQALAYDMVYSDQPTAFMLWAEGAGFDQVSDGLGMLVEQAAESFFIWHDKRPDTGPVVRELRPAK